MTADHGESFGHGYYFNHRAGLWDGVVRVPLIIAGPGVPAGRRITEQVGLIDVTPTALDLAGLPRDARMQGASRRPLLAGAEGAAGSPEVFSITDPWQPHPQFAARTPAHKIIQQSSGAVRSYDLAADPLEDNDGAPVPAALQGAEGRYKAMIGALLEQQVVGGTAHPYSPEECAQLRALGYVDRCQGG